ncbi:MAG TPA: sigma factor-like helix-turn-helix DNA-binding protein [Planctomycetota bacterium]
MSDEELVRRFRDGDDAAFEALYERHHAWIAALALRFLGDRDAALDVLQDTFAYLLRKRATLELRAQMRTFLYPVVKHLALARKERDRRPPPPRPAPAPAAGDVDDLLRGLSDEQKEVVQMRFTDGLELQAIADALEVPLGTVKSRLHAALEILRDRLSNR